MQLLIDESDFPFFLPLEEWNFLKGLADVPVHSLPKEVSAVPKYALDTQQNNTAIRPSVAVMQGGDQKSENKDESDDDEEEGDVEMTDVTEKASKKAVKRALEDDENVPPPPKRRKPNEPVELEEVEGGEGEEKGEGSDKATEKEKEKEEVEEEEEDGENAPTPPIPATSQLTPEMNRAPKRSVIDISSSQSGDDLDPIAKGPPPKKLKLLSKIRKKLCGPRSKLEAAVFPETHTFGISNKTPKL